MKKFVEKDVAENPLYHDTWKLLKKYRDVVWRDVYKRQGQERGFRFFRRPCALVFLCSILKITEVFFYETMDFHGVDRPYMHRYIQWLFVR